jgi:hypothetical protein
VPLFQIAGVVRVLGEETAQKILAETQETEKNGGMMLPDGSRKRTPGGVFFFLARQKLSQADKLAIFRPPKEPKAPPSSSSGDANRFPRRRVIEVAPSRPAPPARSPRPGFVPPELPVAVRKVKAREHAHAAVAGLPLEEQYSVLVDLLAELHDKLGYRIPDSQRTGVFDPPTRPGVVTAGPPSSQRPIPVPESSRVVGDAEDRPTGSDSDKPKRRASAKRS